MMGAVLLLMQFLLMDKVPMCLESRLRESEQELRAVSCGHMAHSDCVNRYMEVSGKMLDESCPYRCHQSIRAVMVA